MSSQPSVNVARLTYLLVCEASGYALALSTKGTGPNGEYGVPLWMGLLGGLIVAGFFILVETLIRGFSLRGFSTATFGLCVGLFCAWLLTRIQVSSLFEAALRERTAPNPAFVETPRVSPAAPGITKPPFVASDPIGAYSPDPENELTINTFHLAFNVALYASFGFIGAVLALRSSRDDFAFIIPYVRFRQDSSAGQPLVLDAEAVMDGRIPAILRAGFLNGRLIVPRFVLDELHTLSNSPASVHRHRGERGLASLEQMQVAKDIQVTIHDTNTIPAEEPMNVRLIETARLLGARLMTGDDNLTKVAKLQNLPVLNIHELVEALKPVVAVGERLRIALVRGGKEEHQAVGYLSDGTMLVVNHAAPKIGSSVDVVVISTLQTNAGTLIFAELGS